MSVRLLAVAASLRAASLNRKLLGCAVEVAARRGAIVDVAEFREFDAPLFNADLLAQSGIPAGVREFERRIEAADGLLLASPEYNYSMPGTLKNLIDWVSRIASNPLNGKSALLLSTSTGLIGGNRGLWALRIPLESLGVVISPSMYSLAQGQKAFTAEDTLLDPAAGERLEKMVAGYLEMAGKLAG